MALGQVFLTLFDAAVWLQSGQHMSWQLIFDPVPGSSGLITTKLPPLAMLLAAFALFVALVNWMWMMVHQLGLKLQVTFELIQADEAAPSIWRFKARNSNCRRAFPCWWLVAFVYFVSWLSFCIPMLDKCRQQRALSTQLGDFFHAGVVAAFPQPVDFDRHHHIRMQPNSTRIHSKPDTHNNILQPLGVKNLIWIFLESTRSDVFPFDYNTQWAKTYLTPQAMTARNITPFLQQLVNDPGPGAATLFYKGRTVDGYTVKSLWSYLCGVMPYPANNLKSEVTYGPFLPCLPELFSSSGYRTRFMQPSAKAFDHEDQEISLIGFKEYFGDFDVINGKLGPKYEKLGYMGYDDFVLLRNITSFVTSQEPKPFFLSIMTNSAHDPYITPNYWAPKWKQYSLDLTVSKVLNCLTYQDEFVQRVFESVRTNKTLMDSTLFVLSGDHGNVMKEHGKWGTFRAQHEPAWDVPFILHTTNPKLAALLKQAPRLTHPPSSLDLSATMLDIFSRDLPLVKRATAAFDESLKNITGQSLLRPGYQSRMQVIYGNPGCEAISVRDYDLGMKATWFEGRWQYYNMTADVGEEHPMQEADLEPKWRDWAQQAKQHVELVKEQSRALYHVHGKLVPKRRGNQSAAATRNRTQDWWLRGPGVSRLLLAGGTKSK